MFWIKNKRICILIHTQVFIYKIGVQRGMLCMVMISIPDGFQYVHNHLKVQLLYLCFSYFAGERKNLIIFIVRYNF